MSQTQIMLNGEGDCWLERNRAGLGKVDHVSEVIADLPSRPNAVLEVGSSNGWRLAKLIETYGCSAMGVDPSKRAGIEAAAKNKVSVRWGTADSLPTLSGWAGVLIYGFCLYLTEPKDWFKIAAEGDRVLAPGGFIIIHDFHGGEMVEPKGYIHHPDVTSYHFDFSRLWLGNPFYHVVRRSIFEDDQMIVVLKKGAVPK